jgi:hypothetical protein
VCIGEHLKPLQAGKDKEEKVCIAYVSPFSPGWGLGIIRSLEEIRKACVPC